MKNCTKQIRENCSNSWNWRKGIIIMIQLLDTVMIWKNHGVSLKKYYKQEPETTNAKQIQNWGKSDYFK